MPREASLLRGQHARPPWGITLLFSSPVPGCVCPESYVRDVCHNHVDNDCPFFGMPASEMDWAHYRAFFPAGEQLAFNLTTEAAS